MAEQQDVAGSTDHMKFLVIDGSPVPVMSEMPGWVGFDEAIRQCRQPEWTPAAIAGIWTLIAVASGESLAEPDALRAAMFGWRTNPIKVVLRHELLGEIKSDADLGTFLLTCHQSGLDPWKREAYPIVRWDQRLRREKVIVGATIDTMRHLRDAVGDFAKLCAPVHTYSDRKVPDSSTLTGFKFGTNDRLIEFSATVLYDDYCPRQSTDSLWHEMPHTCLDNVAEAALYRRMYPRALAKVYTPEEFNSSRGRRPAGPTTPNGDEQPYPDDAGDQTPAERPISNLADLHRALADLGVKSLPERDKLIRGVRTATDGLQQANPARFCARVLDAARQLVAG